MIIQIKFFFYLLFPLFFYRNSYDLDNRVFDKLLQCLLLYLEDKHFLSTQVELLFQRHRYPSDNIYLFG